VKIDWEKFGFVKAGKYRKEIIIALEDSPKTPTELSEETEIHVSHVSNTLKELLERNIVTVLNPNASKGRLYKLTDQGKGFLQKL
jgi:predicted transcriptional regulator